MQSTLCVFLGSGIGTCRFRFREGVRCMWVLGEVFVCGFGLSLKRFGLSESSVGGYAHWPRGRMRRALYRGLRATWVWLIFPKTDKGFAPCLRIHMREMPWLKFCIV